MGLNELSNCLPDFSNLIAADQSGQEQRFALLSEIDFKSAHDGLDPAFTALDGAGGDLALEAGLDAGPLSDIESVHDSKWEEIEKLTQTHRQEIEELRRQHRQEVEVLSGKLGREEIQSLVMALGQMREEIAADILHELAKGLRVIAGEKIEQSSLDAFCQAVSREIVESDALNVAICGPEKLLEKLEPELAGLEANVSFNPIDTDDLTARIDDRVLKTRIGEWRAMLEEADLDH